MLKVTVHDAESVPNFEHIAYVDPMVEVVFQGVNKQTSWQRSTCNPKWNETLNFCLDGAALKSTDLLNIYLKHHEKIGANKLIGQTTVQLNEIVRTGIMRRREIQLVDPQGMTLEATRLYVTVEYKPPNLMNNGKLNTINGETSLRGGGDLWTKSVTDFEKAVLLGSQSRSSKAQDFQIRVKVFQARQLGSSNIHPVCRVRVINTVKQTKIQTGTNHPHFNEVFYFNVNMSEAELCDEYIEFEVCNSRTFRSHMRIGSFKTDLAFIYAQTSHSISRKWLLLSNGSDRIVGAKGYLKVSVNILGPGDEAPAQESGDDYDDIESNLLQPTGFMLRPATFVLKVYKAEDLPQMDSSFFQGVKRIFHTVEDVRELIDPYVVFSFAGRQVSSRIVYTCSHPEFNQELRLGVKFPSMCNKLTLTVMDWDRLQFDDITGSAVLDIGTICDDRESGFLPNFGPCWINIYGAPREYSELPSTLDELNSGKGEGVAYRGRLFVELQTIPGEHPTESVNDIPNSDIIRALPYQSRKKYKLHAAFLDASVLYEHESTVEFEVSIGNYGNKFDNLTGHANCSTTPPTNPVFDGMSYYFLPWGHMKPCVQVASEWEDIAFRLEALNHLSNMKSLIVDLVSKLALLKAKKSTDEFLVRCYQQSCDTVISYLKKPLPDFESGRYHFNELDRLRRNRREKDLADVVQRLEHLKSDGRTSSAIFETLDNVRRMLEVLEHEPQNSIPDVIIWLLANGKRYAYYRLPASQVFYSRDVDYRGRLCGKVQTILLQWPGKASDIEKEKRLFIPAAIRVKIWFGAAIYEHDWLLKQKGADLTMYAETYENQTNVFGQWCTTGPLMTRAPWSDVTGNISLLKKNFQLPPGCKWDGDWYISPEISARYSDDAGHTKYTEEIYEHQYRLIAGAQWQPKTIQWTNLNGDKVPGKNERITAPPGWQWEDDWTIDTDRAVDNEGFQYCVNTTLGSWYPVERFFHLTRRRRWYRTRILKNSLHTGEHEKEYADSECNSGGWEYAPMFNMKFHADERSMDMTRRRRWHRKIVSDTPLLDSNKDHHPSEEVSFNTDIVFRIQSIMTSVTETDSRNGQLLLDPNSDKDKQVKIELTAPRIYLNFKRPHHYELRSYVYQARNLLSMDYDGSSDPYAQIIFMDRSQRTEIVQNSLCPTWNQTLIFTNVQLYNEPEEIYNDPPKILIELFDKDEYGAPDFLGRAQCLPVVCLTPDQTDTNVRLQWFPIRRGTECAGELLAAFELFLLPESGAEQKLPQHPPKRGSLFSVPESIRPKLVRTGIEILCWGIRNMKTFILSDINCPQILFEVAGQQIESTVIKNAKKTPNFDKPLLFLDVMLPEDDLYAPTMNIKVKDHRSFGRKPIVGFHVIKSLESFRCDPDVPTLKLTNSTSNEQSQSHIDASIGDTLVPTTARHTRKRRKALSHLSLAKVKPDEEKSGFIQSETEPIITDKKTMRKRVKNFLKKCKSPAVKVESKLVKIQRAILKHGRHYEHVLNSHLALIEEDIDWWSKYHASKGELNKCGSYAQKGYETLMIYPYPLECHKLYEGFNDFCRTFELFRGKTKFEEENEIVGEFKGLFKVYPLPDHYDESFPHRLMANIPSSGPEECIVRVYVVRGIDLQPKDSNGKSDPYIEIQLGNTIVDNRDERIPNTLNPIFGKMFEVKTVIPLAKDLIVRLKDWDLVTSDDIIGETTIDLENRLLSKYRPTCGLPRQYNLTGPNQWRDNVQPRKILYDVCKRNNLPLPELLDDQRIKIGHSIFRLEDFEQEKQLTIHVGQAEERLALYILHKLHICPEHVETRPLFNTLQPFVEQGRVELFVDIFPKSQGPPGPPFIITPRKPQLYVLRCIIWNTSNVILHDTSITGERMSDIYVKGWMTGMEEHVQKTDIHYRSMDGEGNFNWRFVYQFFYFPAERCISVKNKEYFWSYDATESKIPPILNLQIWDNDKFSFDDFLGSLTLDLNRVQKPTKDCHSCTLEPTNAQLSGYVSIFEMKRLRGWWPCADFQDGNPTLTGKIELELEVLTGKEALERPAGRGREMPNEHPKLQAPQRPDTSFLWFTSPYRAFKHVVWKKSKWYLLFCLASICFFIFLLLFLWSIPSALVSRLLLHTNK